MTFLQHVGNFFKGIFADVTHIAVAAEPIVTVAFPGIAPLYDATVQAVATAEAAGQAAANGASGNGAAKLAAVTAAIEPIGIAYLKQNNITATTENMTAWINAVVATLNALPAPTSGSGATASNVTSVDTKAA